MSSAGVCPDRIKLIMNGVSFADPPNSIQSSTVRRTLGVSDGSYVIGCVASLIPVKAHTDLLNAFARLIKIIPDSLLLLVGDGPLRSDLELMAQNLGLQDTVKFLGYRSDARELYSAFDVFALISHSEGLPMAMLEAMAAALPVVVSAVGAIPAVITPMKNGLLTTPGDIDGIANILICLGNQHELRKMLGKCAYNDVVSQYSVQRMARDYEQVYQEVLDQCP
jgi:glycosyltransferase involved in cell wall biosynthesis